MVTGQGPEYGEGFRTVIGIRPRATGEVLTSVTDGTDQVRYGGSSWGGSGGGALLALSSSGTGSASFFV